MMLVEEGKAVYLVGLDLGQSQDYTALVIIEQAGSAPAHYRLRFIKRFPLRTSYQEIMDFVIRILKSQEFKVHPSALIVDATGVGAPVVDMFKRAKVRPIAVTITGGFEVTRVSGREYRVPKRDLVSTLRLLFDDGRLEIAEGLPEAKVLVDELLNFRLKVSAAGHDTYEPWREGEHDDLVFATALAAWYGENRIKRSKPEGAKSNPKKRKRLIGEFR
jgi:hypothetical protein